LFSDKGNVMNLRYKIAFGLILATGSLPALAAAASAAAPAAPAATSTTLPGGAKSLQETYDDWVVACSTQQTGKACAMQQEQRAQQNGQRVLAIGLRPAGNSAEGTMVLPFGLALAKGASVQVDEGATGAPLAFSTCAPEGCVVPVNFDTKMLTALRKGTTLKVKVVPIGGGDDITLSISLKGFGSALDRTIALLK
jgi:invasion protein IalB